MNGLKLYFTKNQFLKSYMNLGSSYISLNRNNSYYLLGLYYNLSLINLNLFLFKLKKNVKFIINTFLKNNFLSFMVVSTLNNKFLANSYARKYKRIRTSFYFGTWWNGLLKNFKKYTKYNNKKKRFYYLYKNLLPFSVLYIANQKHYKKDINSVNFHNEVNNASIFSIMFVSTTLNSYQAPNVLFQNTRNLINNFFLNNLFFSILKKSLFSLKKKFCFFIFKNFKIFKLKKKTFLNLFFEYYFCNFYKKKFFKKIKWEGDLK